MSGKIWWITASGEGLGFLADINTRKQHVLKSRKHLNYLRELQSKYVLVPADNATNNVIVVCKKYYLEVVLKENTATNTYEFVDKGCKSVVAEHLSFMANSTLTITLLASKIA